MRVSQLTRAIFIAKTTSFMPAIFLDFREEKQGERDIISERGPFQNPLFNFSFVIPLSPKKCGVPGKPEKPS